MFDRTVTTAVLPAAGLGTRFLPATKAVPKELLPLVDRPAIQYAVEECVDAGVDDVLIVTAMGKGAIEDHFDHRIELEVALERSGKHDLLQQMRELATLARVHAVRQPEPLGLGHAVLMARDHVGVRSFAVLLGDDLVHPSDKLLRRMIDLHQGTGRAVVAVMEVPGDQTDRYGVVDAVATDVDGVLDVVGLVEKPAPGTAPSNLIVIGRYVLPGEVFEVLADLPPGRGGEIQLTDALAVLAEREPILAVRCDGQRDDLGDKLGFLQATVRYAAERDDLGPQFVAWLRDWLATADEDAT